MKSSANWPILLLAFLFLAGCTSLRPPKPSPSPLPEVSIALPSFSVLNSTFSDCLKGRCAGTVGMPVLVLAENRINRTTYEKRLIPLDVPECQIVEVGFDKGSLMLEKRQVEAPDFSTYYLLYYFVPLQKGSFKVKLKNACQLRGSTYEITAK